MGPAGPLQGLDVPRHGRRAETCLAEMELLKMQLNVSPQDSAGDDSSSGFNGSNMGLVWL